ncbi:MAG TPA: ATP-binding cassette domain-containing protein [Trebonia sp.]
MNVIETAGLGKRYGKSWALQDCTLAVPEGSLAALVGPNGAGKSTLMNMAVRRPAGPGRADRCPGPAAPAAHPRRTPVGARSPGPPGLPGDGDDRDGRRRRVRPAVLARARRT